MFVDFHILNELGSPSINSNTFANRPPAGQIGRLFVSTDTYEIYRDNGSTWDLIGGPGSSSVTGTGAATQVAYWTASQAIGGSNNLWWDNTNKHLGIGISTPSGLIHADGGASAARMILDADAGVARIFSFRSDNLPRWAFRVDGAETGSNAGADLAVRAYNDTGAFTFAPLTIARATGKAIWQATEAYTTGIARGNYFDYNLSISAGGSFSSPNSISAVGATLDLTLNGNATIPSGARSGLDAYNTVSFTGSGTLTHSQGTQIRAYSNLTTGWAFAGSATGTITHLAGLRVLFPDNSGSAVTVTNNYALLLNDQTANTGTVTYTNRWGVYQEGASDINYFAANVIIGSTTNSGQALQVTGAGRFSSSVTAVGADFGGTVSVSGTDYFHVDDDPTLNATANNQVIALLRFRQRGSDGAFSGVVRPLLISENNSGGLHYVQLFEKGLRIGPYSGGNSAIVEPTAVFEGRGTDTSINLLDLKTNGGSTVILANSGGNVLIGTTTDAGQKLQVNGNIKIDAGTSTNLITGTVQNGVTALISTTDPVNSDRIYNLGFGSSNYVSQGRIEVYATENWSATNRGCEFRIRTTPNAGTTPTNRIIVKNGGQVKFVPLAADPAGAEAGDVYYNSGTNKLRLYDGTNWVDLN